MKPIGLLDSKVDHIIDMPMLRNSSHHRLVVRTCINARQTIRARVQPACNVSGEDAPDSGCVQAFEEGEVERRGRGRLGQAGQGFDDDVRVPDDLPGTVHLARSSIVVLR